MATKEELEAKTIPQLLDYGWRNLILIPPIKEQGKRGERKQLLITGILEGRAKDLSRLPLQQLKDYVREHRLFDPGLSAKKGDYLDIIESGKLPERRIVVLPKREPVVNEGYWENVLLQLKIDIIYRLSQTSSIVRRIVNRNKYWSDRAHRERILVSGSDTRSDTRTGTQRWYLDFKKWPIGTEVVAAGENPLGELGITSRKSRIDRWTKVPLPKIISLDSYMNLTIFISTDGRAYSCGNYRRIRFGEPETKLGWDLSDKQIAKLYQKSQHAPPQLMTKVSQASMVVIVNRMVFFLVGKGELWVFDLVTEDYQRLDDLLYTRIDRYTADIYDQPELRVIDTNNKFWRWSEGLSNGLPLLSPLTVGDGRSEVTSSLTLFNDIAIITPDGMRYSHSVFRRVLSLSGKPLTTVDSQSGQRTPFGVITTEE